MRAQLSIVLIVQTLFASSLTEMSPNGSSLEIELNNDGDVSKLTFSDQGTIEYSYINRRIDHIIRYSSTGEELYQHTYFWQDDLLISDTGWFTTQYIYDQNNRVIAKFSPWQQDTIEYNAEGQIVRINQKLYTYDNQGQITSESGCFFATYDDQCNLLLLNGKTLSSDPKTEPLDCSYDAYGRRIRKGTTSYLYLGLEEIASYKDGCCVSCKVPGLGGPIAIEIEGKPYAPVIDPIGIIRKLIDPETNTIFAETNCDIFGANLSDVIPYAYRGKRFDSDTGLIYFGKRYYDPMQHRWTSPDPCGSIDPDAVFGAIWQDSARLQLVVLSLQAGLFLNLPPLVVLRSDLGSPHRQESPSLGTAFRRQLIMHKICGPLNGITSLLKTIQDLPNPEKYKINNFKMQ